MAQSSGAAQQITKTTTRGGATTRAYSALVNWDAFNSQTEDIKLVVASAFGYPGDLPASPEEASILLSNCANAEYSGLVGEPEIGYGLIQAFNFCDRNPYMWAKSVSLVLVGVPGDTVSRMQVFLSSGHLHEDLPTSLALGRELLVLRDNVFPDVQDPRTGKTNFLMYEFLTIAAEELVQGGTLKDPSWVLAPLARKMMVSGRAWWESSPVPTGMPAKLNITGALEYSTRRKTLAEKWGALISGPENFMTYQHIEDLQGFGDKPVVKTWKTHYREMVAAKKTDFNWKNGVTKWVSALFLRWHYRNDRLYRSGLSGEILSSLCNGFPSLVPYVLAAEGLEPQDSAKEAYAKNWITRNDPSEVFHPMVKDYSEGKQNLLGFYVEVVPWVSIDWRSPGGPDDRISQWITNGMPGMFKGLERTGGSLCLRTDDWSAVEKFIYVLDWLANRQYSTVVSKISMLVCNPQVGPDGWEDYLDRLDHAGAVVKRRFPWFVPCDVSQFRGHRKLSARTPQQVSLLASSYMVDPSAEFFGGGLLFKAIPVGPDRNFATALMLVGLAVRVHSGDIDTRPFILPSTGGYRIGVDYGHADAVDAEISPYSSTGVTTSVRPHMFLEALRLEAPHSLVALLGDSGGLRGPRGLQGMQGGTGFAMGYTSSVYGSTGMPYSGYTGTPIRGGN